MLCFVSIARTLIDPQTGTFTVDRGAIRSNLEDLPVDSKSNTILVYDAADLPHDGSDLVKLTIADARNGVPYMRPLAVRAAGGYVVRTTGGGPEVLLIFRRGVWDLPKGKLDKGETAEEGALREVREEVAAEDLRIIKPVGITVHGYPDRGRYAVKTTHWFLMESRDDAFTPQVEEEIAAVRWVSWVDAKEMLGYDTLRDHIATVNP